MCCCRFRLLSGSSLMERTEPLESGQICTIKCCLCLLVVWLQAGALTSQCLGHLDWRKLTSDDDESDHWGRCALGCGTWRKPAGSTVSVADVDLQDVYLTTFLREFQLVIAEPATFPLHFNTRFRWICNRRQFSFISIQAGGWSHIQNQSSTKCNLAVWLSQLQGCILIGSTWDPLGRCPSLAPRPSSPKAQLNWNRSLWTRDNAPPPSAIPGTFSAKCSGRGGCI